MSDCASASDCFDSVDPRVQIELERLNTATDDINKLEVDLDEARLVFRQLLFESNFKIQSLAKKLGNCIEKSRPYYEARFKANKALQEMRATAVLYEKANSAHAAAREMVYLAEQGLCRLCEESQSSGAGGVPLDPAWQEMLNHATARVNQAEAERASAGARHRITADQHRTALTAARSLQHSLKRHVAKSRPYFEEKARYNSQLDTQKNKIQVLEKEISNAKLTYAQALRNLEKISEEIHRHRSSFMSQNPPNLPTKETSSHSPEIPDNKPKKSEKVSPDKTSLANGTKTKSMDNVSPVEKVKSNQISKSESIREWIKQNGASNPLNDFDATPSSSSDVKKTPVVRPKSLPQDFCDKYSDLLTPFQQNVPSKSSLANQTNQNRNSASTPSTVSKNGPESDNWIEINLEYSSPEEISFEKCSNFSTLDSYKQIPYERMPNDDISQDDSVSQHASPTEPKPVKSVEFEKQDNIIPNSKVSADSPRRIIRNRLIAQKSLPVNSLSYQLPENQTDVQNENAASKENPNHSLKAKLKPDISTWISRSSAKAEEDLQFSPTRRQSLDVILNDTGEKMKEIFSQGFMMFHISSLTERRNSEPKVPQTEKLSPNQKDFSVTDTPQKGNPNRTIRKMPSPLDKTLSYLNVCSENNSISTNSDDQGSDTDSLASVEMLSDDQIQSLMLDGHLEVVCQQMLGMNNNGKTDEATVP